MGDEPQPRMEQQLLRLFDRVRRVALEQNPLDDCHVTGPQLTLLEWLAASPGCGIRELADGLGLTAPTVSVAVRRLEEAGLVGRQLDPADGRAVRLFLTLKGQALQELARAFRLEKMRRLLSGLSAEEQQKLLSLLMRSLDAVEGE